MTKNLFSPINNILNSIIQKFGYNKIFTGLITFIVIVSFIQFFINFSFSYNSIIRIICDLIFASGFFYLTECNIKHYFLFFLYFFLRISIEIKGLFLFGNIITILLILLILLIFLLLFLHGIKQWSSNCNNGLIIPNKVGITNVLLFILFSMLFSFVIGKLILGDLSFGLILFQALNLIFGIYLINMLKVEAWLPIIVYFIITCIDSYSLNFELLKDIIYIIISLFAYKYWNFINYMSNIDTENQPFSRKNNSLNNYKRYYKYKK